MADKKTRIIDNTGKGRYRRDTPHVEGQPPKKRAPMSTETIRKELKEFRAAAVDFRHKLRAAKKNGFAAEEKSMLKAELLEVVKEGGDVLDATLDTIKEVTDSIASKF